MAQIFKTAVLVIFFLPLGIHAAPGLYGGIGIPHQSQLGLTYDFSNAWMLELSYNHGNSITSCKKFDLKVIQFGLNAFPSAGNFFLGAGVTQSTMTAGETDSTSKLDFTMDGSATRVYAKLGWIWGRADRGFWYGIDLSAYQTLTYKKETDVPAGVDVNSREYLSVDDVVKVFIQTQSLNLTFFRLGWSF